MRHARAGAHGLTHGERDDPAAVEARRERVAHPADRLGQLLALALDLLHLRLELNRHVVELTPQLGELVVAVERHQLTEVAA